MSNSVLIGRIADSLQTNLMSEPEYPAYKIKWHNSSISLLQRAYVRVNIMRYLP